VARIMSPTKKVTHKDWVDTLLGLMDEDRTPADKSAISIESVAAVLRVTKGAFYPHFASVAALHKAAIAEWLRDRLEAMPQTAVSSEGAVRDPLDRIRKIGEALATSGTRDGAMRRWAASEPEAAKAVALADRIVISHLEHALIDLGFPGREATAQAVGLAAALRSHSVAADQETFGLILDGLARTAAFAGQNPVVQSSDAAGAVVLYTRPGRLTGEHLQAVQRILDLLAAPHGQADPAGDPDAGISGAQEHVGGA